MQNLTLSFDNGPDPEVTPFVLDVLARRGIRATFFVIGRKLADPACRALAERAAAEGHWVGNHTYTHSGPLGLMADSAMAVAEVVDTQRLLGDLAGAKRLFRPCGGGGQLNRGLLQQAVVARLKQDQQTCVLWNAIPRDWVEPETWVERALDQIAAQGWSLMVLHDLPTGAMRHLERFLDAVAEAGHRIRQDFPPDCVPIRRGQVVRPIGDYVADMP